MAGGVVITGDTDGTLRRWHLERPDKSKTLSINQNLFPEQQAPTYEAQVAHGATVIAERRCALPREPAEPKLKVCS